MRVGHEAADAPVVIAGGSYAGLAAASALGHRALIVDQHEIGAIQHSACAMPYPIAERFGVAATVLQRYSSGFVHTARGTTRFRLDPAFCIFDHEALSRRLFARSGARFLHARIQGFDGQILQTTAGPVRADVYIDATGWPAALATALRPELRDDRRLTMGIEAEIPGRAEGIHFFFDPAIVRRGYAWNFPAGDTLRVGVGAFEGSPKLGENLQALLDRLGLKGQPERGGRIPWFDRPPVLDNLFLTGDAAGHCVPLTAEGIRFALHFGDLAGRTTRDIVDGTRTLADGQTEYHRRISIHRRRAALMRFAQGFVGVLPNDAIHYIARTLSQRPLERRFIRRYVGWSD